MGWGGVADTLDSLSSQVGKICYLDEGSGTNYSDILTAFQEKWSSFSTGFTFWTFRRGTRGIAIVWKYDSSNGTAIAFGATAAFNPPILIRYTEGTWYSYNFTVTQN